MPRLDDKGHCRGPIGGLLLPPNIWYVLRREKIKTISELRGLPAILNGLMGSGPRGHRRLEQSWLV